MKTVIVKAHPDTNLVITPSATKPEFGKFRVDSRHVSMENGFVNVQKRTAFIAGRTEDLQALGYRAEQSIAGQIIKKESFSPFYAGQEPKINPESKEVVLTNGKPTYLQYEFTQDLNAHDVWVGETSEQISAEVEARLAEQTVN